MRIQEYLIIGLIILPLCLAGYEKPQDLSTSCQFLAKQQSHYIKADSDSYGRCVFCQYSYNDRTDKVFGGCKSCPDDQGNCEACIEGYTLFDGKCIFCGENVLTCDIVNKEFSADPLIKQVISDIKLSSAMSAQQKAIATMEVYQKYLALRADKCTRTTEDGIVVELGHMCKKFENCEKLDKTSTSISCSRCKPNYYFDEEFKCVSECKAHVVKFISENNYSYKSQQSCQQCNYNGTCKTCPNGTIEMVKIDQAYNALPHNHGSLKVCQQCSENCLSCSVSSTFTSQIKCEVCEIGYFYNANNNSCDECSIEEFLLSPINSQQKSSLKIQCNGSKFENIILKSSYVRQVDALNQSVDYSINITTTKTNEKKIYLCGSGAIACKLNENMEIINTECMYGYALKNNECVECSKLVKNSILCEVNQTQYIRKDYEFLPTLCKVGNSFTIPYSDFYILQIAKVDVKNTLEQYPNYQIPHPDNWCQLNTKSCRRTMQLLQKAQLEASYQQKIEDIDFYGQCSDCFEDAHIPEFYRKIDNQDFFMLDVQPKQCFRCSDIGGKKCKIIGKELVIDECPQGSYLDNATKKCLSCDKSCSKCENNSNECTECPTGKYLNASKTCQLLEPVQKLANCKKQLLIDNKYSCQECEMNYMTSLKETNIYECVGIQIPFCENITSEGKCERCIQNSQDGKKYYLDESKTKCSAIPTGCAQFKDNKCLTCQYSYKLVSVNESQICIPCYQSYEDLQSYITYDCPGKVKTSLEDDSNGIDIKTQSLNLVLGSLLSFAFYVLF